MSIASDISSHLPYLRRFSRALSGTQASGDAYVAATLGALVADPSAFPRDLPAREAVYKVFLAHWRVDAEPPQGPHHADLSAVDRNLEGLGPLSRQAFLLRTVEGFTLTQVAEILATTEEAAGRLIEQAGREIAAQVSTTVLIIEDEPIIALDIEALVLELGHEVTGIARTRQIAIAMAKVHRPGLILADMQLADGSSGLDAVNDILEDGDVPVIFITAFPERLLTGEKPEPAFLVTKPFQTDVVKAAISQALFFDRRSARSVPKSAP